MRVYAIEEITDYEGSDILKFFSDEFKAKEWLFEYLNDNKYPHDEYRIWFMHVDSDESGGTVYQFRPRGH